jgi:bifunctional non-homologous end joining protein LigD
MAPPWSVPVKDVHARTQPVLKDWPANGRTSTLPKRLQPMLATLTDAPFDDPGWVFEDKYDGFRMIAEIRRGKVALYSRNGKIISHSYIEERWRA